MLEPGLVSQNSKPVTRPPQVVPGGARDQGADRERARDRALSARIDRADRPSVPFHPWVAVRPQLVRGHVRGHCSAGRTDGRR